MLLTGIDNMKRGPFGKCTIGALVLLNSTLLLLLWEPCGGFVSPTFIGSSGRHVACSPNRPWRKCSNTTPQMSARGSKGDHEVSDAGIKLNKGELQQQYFPQQAVYLSCASCDANDIMAAAVFVCIFSAHQGVHLHHCARNGARRLVLLTCSCGVQQ